MAEDALEAQTNGRLSVSNYVINLEYLMDDIITKMWNSLFCIYALPRVFY